MDISAAKLNILLGEFKLELPAGVVVSVGAAVVVSPSCARNPSLKKKLNFNILNIQNIKQ